MKPTLKLLLSRIEDWCDNHTMITDFSHGELSNIEFGKKRSNWVLVHIFVQPPSIRKRNVVFNLEFIIMGMTQSNPETSQADLDSVKQVQSDLLQIVQDFVAELVMGDSYFYNDGKPLFSIEGDNVQISAEPFIEDFAQWTTGFTAPIAISALDPLNQCDVPYLGEYSPTPPSGECSVEITNSDGDVLATVGSDYEVGDSSISVNGSSFTDLPATDSLDIEVVRDSDGTTQVGAIIDGKHQIREATVNLYESDGTTLLRSVTVDAEDTASDTIFQGTVQAVLNNGNQIASQGVESEEIVQLNIPVRNTSATDVGGVASGAVRVGDSTVNVRKSDNTLISAESVAAEASSDYQVSDNQINLNGTDTGHRVKATDTFDIIVYDDEGAQVTGATWDSVNERIEVPAAAAAGDLLTIYPPIMIAHAGSSAANYDGGWLRTNGYLHRDLPSSSSNIQVQEADITSSGYNGILYNNIHGNKSRFTLDDGTAISINTYTPHNRIHQDHATGIEWIYPDDSTYTWANALHDPTATLGSNGTGWFLPPFHFFAAASFSGNNQPLLAIGVRSNQDYWTSTQNFNNTTKAIICRNNTSLSNAFMDLVKTNTRRRVLCRLMDNPETSNP